MLYDENNIRDLQLFFDNYPLLPKELHLGPGERIIDLPKFLFSHFEILREGRGHSLNDVFYLRLTKARDILVEINKVESS